jgi:two-component system phosphate regulon sensor histidine kinase PhoR
MKRISIWLLTLFMILALAGLILVQAFWIKNAIAIKENQFDQLVNNAMTDISETLQEKEAVRLVMEEMRSVGSDTSEIRITVPDRENTDVTVVHNLDSVHKSASSQQPEKMIAEHADEILQYHSDSLILIEEKLAVTSPGAKEVVTQRVYFESVMGKKILDKKVFLNRVISGMFFIAPEIENRIRQQELEEIIGEALLQRGISLNHEYAVVKWNDAPVYQSADYNAVTDNDFYRAQLFPDDIFASSNYLSLYFPKKRNFLMKSFGFMIFSSVFLTSVIIMAFSFTLFYVFRQKKLAEIRNDFVNNMTHELKTPISTISLASQMLGDNSLPPTLKNVDHISRVISEESRRLGFQVEKVLQMAVLDKGQAKLRCKETDLHELIGNVADNYMLQIRSRGGLIQLRLEAENHILEIDPVHITNVLTNLIDNAIKYCNREPEIRIYTQNIKETLAISISDNGIGINKADQKRIFEKFYRVPTGNIHAVKGFGLGLSYVKKIIEEHKGTIEVESQLFEGSTFVIKLPLLLNESGK